LTIISTVSPLLMPSSLRDSRVITEAMRERAETSTLTRHITLPLVMSVTVAVMRLRAPSFMVHPAFVGAEICHFVPKLVATALGSRIRGIWVTGWEARFRVVVLFQYAPPASANLL